jgi:peptide/nickel transport system permease protein
MTVLTPLRWIARLAASDSPLASYILRRLLMIPLMLFGITVMVFCVIRFAPGAQEGGGVVEGGGLDAKARAEVEKYLREKMGLDKPLPVQYWNWLTGLFDPEKPLGFSIKHNRPVWDLIRERLPVTLGLNLIAFAISYTIAIPLGLVSAVQHNRPFDRTASVVTFLLFSLPSIWVGSSLLGYFANPEYPKLDKFPTGLLHSEGADRMLLLDYIADLLWHIVLPVVTLSYAGFAYLSKQMRAGMLDNLRQDYVRTARAKGLPGHTVVLRHALRNSLIPVVTVLATILPALIAGSVIVERIFSIPGMGYLTYEAVTTRDFQVVQATAAFAGLLNMIGLLLADITYAILDPRITYD